MVGVSKQILVMILLLAAGGCSDGEMSPEPTQPGSSTPNLTMAELLGAPDTLLADGAYVYEEPYLNRDFFPQSPPEGRPLAAVVFLNGTPAGILPPSVSDVYLWAIRDSSEVWRTKLDFQFVDWTRNGAHHYLGGNGPLWDPGFRVDVVVGVRTSASNVSLVIFHDVTIHSSI